MEKFLSGDVWKRLKKEIAIEEEGSYDIIVNPDGSTIRVPIKKGE